MIYPEDIRRMDKVLEANSKGYFDRTTIFQRFLEYVIAGFDPTGSKLEHPYDSAEGTICMALFQEWVMIMHERVHDGGWYDLLGEWYMTGIAGAGKKSWTGQFFTPPHICDFMTRIVESGENKGESVIDNACGSGRMLLAAHALHPQNYCGTQDLDRLCCLMTVCNFLIHGVNGEVVWGDGLNPTDYRQGWRVNSQLGILGIPTVLSMDKNDSLIYRSGICSMAKPSNPTPPPPKSKAISHKKSIPQYEQLSLFD